MTFPRINTSQLQFILSNKLIFEEFTPNKPYKKSIIIRKDDNLYLSKYNIEGKEEFDLNDWIKFYNSNDIDGFIGNLDESILNEINRALEAERILQDNIDNEETARINADSDLRDLIDETSGDLEAEIARATNAETQLQTNINNEEIARINSDIILQSYINDEESRAIARENEIEANSIQESIVPNVTNNVELVQENVLLALKKTTQDTNTGNTTVTQTPFQMVSETQNGMMTKEAYNQIYNNDSRIATLEGASKRYPTHLGTGSHTQAEYQAEWERLSGNPAGTIPPDGTTLLNLDNNHAITYFANAEGDKWIDRGVDTVTLGNQSTPGIVQGSNDNGKVYIEANGTMSLNGYDNLVAEDIRIDSALSQEINDRIAEVNRATAAENLLRTDLNAEINRATDIEDGLRNDLNNEINRATAAEETLQDNIDDLNTDLTAESTARATRDSELTTYIENVETSLNAEINRASGAESNLQSQIDTLNDNLEAEITRATTAEGTLQDNIDTVSGNLTQEINDRITAISNVNTDLSTHINNNNNPHNVTKAQVGLSNVNNTADLDKPISTATQTALNAKQDTLTAGNNITITNNVISAADGTTVTFRIWEANE